MQYVRRVLQPGESVVLITTYHWLVYWRAALIIAVCLILAIASMMVDHHDTSVALEAVALILALFAFSAWLRAFIQRTTTELAITDRRVIYKTGLLWRRTMEMNRSKVETVSVDQSIPGRLLGYGTIVVRGTGGSLEPIPFIADPLTFRSHITAG
jgi:uncharacterized membrane protein YdbT with pleckstrin-like domain